MGYVLIDGKRYYKGPDGKASRDDVSKEEANQREKREAALKASHIWNEKPGPVRRRRSIPWAGVLTGLAAVLLTGALWHNHVRESPAREAILEYMEEMEAGEESRPQA